MSPAWIRPRPVTKSSRNPRGKTWQVLYRRGGRDYPIVSAGTFKTEREARSRRDLVAGWLAHGLNPRDELARLAAAPAAVKTVQQWADAFEKSLVDLEESTRTAKHAHLLRITDQHGRRDPATLDVADMQAYVTALSDDLAASSVKVYFGTYQQLLDFAGVTPNPARSDLVRFPKRGRTIKQPPDADHVLTIITGAAVKYRLALVVLEQTAMRIGELCALEWGDVDEAGSRLRLRAETTKTKRPRWVELPGWLMTIVAATCAREDRAPQRRVFQGLNVDNLRAAMVKTCRDAGIPHYTPHTLRHRRGTIWHHGGVPAKVLMERGGWTTSEIAIEVYAHEMPLAEVPRATLEPLLVMPR